MRGILGLVDLDVVHKKRCSRADYDEKGHEVGETCAELRCENSR
jgi:hypothetical protein